MDNKKSQVITELFKICQKNGDFTFHNNLVKKVSAKLGFGNPFDVTKLDNKSKLPEILLKNDMSIVHLGSGYHKFVKGIDKLYHEFEPIKKITTWNYRKSLLNRIHPANRILTFTQTIRV